MRVNRRTRFEHATCGPGHFRNRNEKVADAKSGYMWKRPLTFDSAALLAFTG